MTQYVFISAETCNEVIQRMEYILDTQPLLSIRYRNSYDLNVLRDKPFEVNVPNYWGGTRSRCVCCTNVIRTNEPRFRIGGCSVHSYCGTCFAMSHRSRRIGQPPVCFGRCRPWWVNDDGMRGYFPSCRYLGLNEQKP